MEAAFAFYERSPFSTYRQTLEARPAVVPVVSALPLRSSSHELLEPRPIGCLPNIEDEF